MLFHVSFVCLNPTVYLERTENVGCRLISPSLGKEYLSNLMNLSHLCNKPTIKPPIQSSDFKKVLFAVILFGVVILVTSFDPLESLRWLVCPTWWPSLLTQRSRPSPHLPCSPKELPDVHSAVNSEASLVDSRTGLVALLVSVTTVRCTVKEGGFILLVGRDGEVHHRGEGRSMRLLSHMPPIMKQRVMNSGTSLAFSLLIFLNPETSSTRWCHPDVEGVFLPVNLLWTLVDRPQTQASTIQSS